MRLTGSISRIAGLMLLCFAGGIISTAQERPSWGPAVSFPNGTFIQTGIGSVPPGELGVDVTNPSVVTSDSTRSDQGVFRRILKLSDGRAIIYELAVKRIDEGKHFEINLASWTPTVREAQELDVDLARLEVNFLRNYSAPLTINDGDTLALDVLINPRTGVKLVDYFRITSRQPISHTGLGNLSASARPLEIGDVEFFVDGFELQLDGKMLYTSKGGMGGRFIWIDVPQTGRFIFSLTPLSEADGFYRTAHLTRQQIVFTNGTSRYELTSGNPIIPASGVFSLWVRLDPTFSFPSPATRQMGNYFSIGAADSLPLQQRKN